MLPQIPLRKRALHRVRNSRPLGPRRQKDHYRASSIRHYQAPADLLSERV